MWLGCYGCNGHCLTGEAGPCGLNPVWGAPAPTPNDTTSAMCRGGLVVEARRGGRRDDGKFDFFGLLWDRGRRCLASIRDCTDTFWGADCAWKVDIPHSGLIRECPGPGGPRTGSPSPPRRPSPDPEPSVAYKLTDPWDLLNYRDS